MKTRISIASIIILCFAIFCSPANSTTLQDTFHKRYKLIKFPHEEVIVKLTVETAISHIHGNKAEHEVLRAYDVQQALIRSLLQSKWYPQNELHHPTIDAGKITIELGEGMSLKGKRTHRIVAYIYQCDSPRRKLRGGDIQEFFQRIIEEAEECLAYDEKLQGKNYPY